MPRTSTRLAPILALALLALLSLLSSRASAAPLLTGFLDEQSEIDGAHRDTNMDNMKLAGATGVRYFIYWSQLASTKPAQPTDPQSYDWTKIDRMVISAHDRGLEPILDIARAPHWAEQPLSEPVAGQGPGSANPKPNEFHDFALAAATRYSGAYAADGGSCTPNVDCLPRVRYWQAWNEPNYPWFLVPQYNSSGAMVSPGIYRNLVNAFADAVRSVTLPSAAPRNFVIAGGTGPWGHPKSPSPLAFARAVLCIQPSCNTKTKFDAWSTHPYTKGGPTHKAKNAGDVEIGDLPALRKVLNAAQSKGKIVNVNNASKADLWVTEFSWDSNAPDPKAVPMKLHQRWTSEALYRMWQSQVRMLVWFTVRDRPLPESFWQSGFWYCGQPTTADDLVFNPGNLCAIDPANDVRKPSFEAFRFPFIAFAKNGKVSVWGRVPPGASKFVAIQRKKSGSFKKVKSLKADSAGIFRWTQSTSWTTGFYRAKISGETSLAFALKRPKAYALKQPFGCGAQVPC
jgi:hypothetical protein